MCSVLQDGLNRRTPSNHPSSCASDGPAIAVTFSQPCHSWSDSFFFCFFLSLSSSPSSTWLCLDLLPVMLRGFWRTTSRQRFFFLRCNFVFGRLSVDSHYVSCGRGPPLGICQFVAGGQDSQMRLVEGRKDTQGRSREPMMMQFFA